MKISECQDETQGGTGYLLQRGNATIKRQRESLVDCCRIVIKNEKFVCAGIR